MNKKIKILFGVFFIFLFAIFVIWLINSYADHKIVYSILEGEGDEILEFISNFKQIAFFVFILLIVLECVFAPIPPLILYIAGGAIFGGFVAGCLALIGNLIGATISFQISRTFGREWIRKKIPQKIFEKVDKFSEKYGATSIFLLRINPLTSSDLFSYAAGLTKMKFKKFLLWTGLAIIPMIFLQTYLGGEIIKSKFLTQISIIGGVLYLALFFIIYFLLKKEKTN